VPFRSRQPTAGVRRLPASVLSADTDDEPQLFMLSMTHSRTRAAALAWALVVLLLCGPGFADEQSPVRSLLEIRRAQVMIQNWDLSCGAAALGTLLRYEFGDPVTEKEIARALISRGEYIEHPELVKIREGFSLLDLKRYVQTRGYKGLRFFADRAAKKWPLRGSLKYAGVLLAYPP
jgi:hypothetical protein